MNVVVRGTQAKTARQVSGVGVITYRASQDGWSTAAANASQSGKHLAAVTGRRGASTATSPVFSHSVLLLLALLLLLLLLPRRLCYVLLSFRAH